MHLEFGVHLPIHGIYSYEDIMKVAVTADKLGYNSLWVGDHFYLPREYYVNTGGDPAKPDKLDAWTILAALAGQTEKIRLGTRVSPIPFYIPARLAKIVTTVDIISGGRVDFGVGAGWFKEEAVSYGVWWGNHKERISKMLEGLEVILKLWTEDKATYKGRYYTIQNAPFWPKPIQKPYPPIWFGGSSKAILEATVKYGKGLFPLPDTPLGKFKEISKRIVETMEEFGRKRKISLASSLSYPEGLGEKPPEWISKVESYVECGADTILIDISKTCVPPNKALTLLRDFSKSIFPRYSIP